MGIVDAHRTMLSACLLFTYPQSVHGRVRAMLSGGEEHLMDEALAMQIDGLRKLKTKALKARYRELFGEESRSSNHAHLFRRIAWRLQAKTQGDLSERARKRAAELANDADLRLGAPRRYWRADGSVRLEPTLARDPRLPPVGTVLKRVYGERTIDVTVLGTLRVSGQAIPFVKPDCAA